MLRGPAEPEKGKTGNWEHRPGQRAGRGKGPGSRVQRGSVKKVPFSKLPLSRALCQYQMLRCIRYSLCSSAGVSF